MADVKTAAEAAKEAAATTLAASAANQAASDAEKTEAEKTEAVSTESVLVQFEKPWSLYNKGEKATVDAAQAARLIEKKIAVKA